MKIQCGLCRVFKCVGVFAVIGVPCAESFWTEARSYHCDTCSLDNYSGAAV